MRRGTAHPAKSSSQQSQVAAPTDEPWVGGAPRVWISHPRQAVRAHTSGAEMSCPHQAPPKLPCGKEIKRLLF